MTFKKGHKHSEKTIKKIKENQRGSYKKRICKYCGKVFIPTNGRQKYCLTIECQRGKNKGYYIKREKKIKLYYEQNKEKYRNKSNKRRLKLRFEILKRDNFTCQYCGRKSPEVILEIDHIYPKSKGGLDKAENYITACSDCNVGKGDSILNEFK